jgi:hypothetical protein
MLFVPAVILTNPAKVPLRNAVTSNFPFDALNRANDTRPPAEPDVLDLLAQLYCLL